MAVLHTRDLALLLNELREVTDPHKLGINLCIDPARVTIILKNAPGDVERQKSDVLEHWLKNDSDASWSSLVEALKKGDHVRLAEQLENTYIKKATAGRKRKVTSSDDESDDVLSKRVKLDERSTTVGPVIPSEVSHAATAHNDCAYFATGNQIFEYNVQSQNWIHTFKCPQEIFGLAAIENELILVGGLVEVEDSDNFTPEPTNKVQSLTLSTSSKQMWQEKYLEMAVARVWPQVVVSGKYLIALGGWTDYKKGSGFSKPTTSVEVLDLEKKCWFSNDNISLPEEFTTAKWLSACICGKNLFVAAKNDDPNFTVKMESIIDDEEDGDHNYEYDPDGPYPCFSMYRCTVERLLQIAQKKGTEDDIIWQQLHHPHPSVYKNDNCVPNNVKYYNLPDLDDPIDENTPMYPFETEYMYYNLCSFTLSCIDDTLIAVGCKHIEFHPPDEVETLLDSAYSTYRELKRTFYCRDWRPARIVDCCDTSDGRRIYLYYMENNSWKPIKASISETKQRPVPPPVVTVVKNNIVILQNRTPYIVTC